jgi:ribosome-binding protein aMBF1 (putative translation factor)
LTVTAWPGTISIIPKFRIEVGPLEASSRYSETLVNSLSDLGRIVREQRRASGLRIDDAAALCGVSVDLLSRLENGHSGVGTARLLKVLDGLGLAIMVVDKSRLADMPAAEPTDR